jgi:hypothetical protein
MYRSSSVGRRGGPILIAVGVLQLVIGASFVIALGSMPYAGAGMSLTGLVLIAIGIGLIVAGVVWFRRARDLDRISATGIPGTAQITGLTQTGTMINQQPVIGLDLLVHLPDRPPYPVSKREIVPLILLGSLQQGSLPVKVDPARPDKVVIQWDQVGIGGYGQTWATAPGTPSAPGVVPAGQAFAAPATLAPGDETLGQVAAAMSAVQAVEGTPGAAAPMYSQPAQAGLSIDQLRAHLRANGISGLARIDQLQDSGNTVGNERLFTMTSTIFVQDRIPYVSGPSAAMVPLEKVARIAVGVELPVKVAPDNPGLVMFEWDRI